MIRKITFDEHQIATGITETGKAYTVYQNDTNIRKPYYQLYINGKQKFTRGGMNKVLEVINSKE